MCGHAARAVLNEATVWTARCLVRLSSSASGKPAQRMIPALLIRMSRRPKPSTAASTTAGPRWGRHVAAVRVRRSAGGGDLRHHRRRRCRVGPGPVNRTPQVVDHHRGPAGGEEQRVGPSDPAPRAGDDGDPAIEAISARDQIAQAATGALNPSRPPRVPPTMASRSSAGIPANCSAMSWRLPRNVPSACG